MRSKQYISNINAAPTCFGAVHAPSSGSSKFLMKYVYATSCVPRIVKVDVEYCMSRHARYLQLTGHTILNIHFHYPRHSWRSVNILYFIRNFELPEDGACTAPKHVGAALIFEIYCSLRICILLVLSHFKYTRAQFTTERHPVLRPAVALSKTSFNRLAPEFSFKF
jgi:hypothetical protein